MRIGFIGLGNVGAPLARNLQRAGHEITLRAPGFPAELVDGNGGGGERRGQAARVKVRGQRDQVRRAAPAIGAAESWDRHGRAGRLQQAIEQVALAPAGHGAKGHDAPGRGQPVDVPA